MNHEKIVIPHSRENMWIYENVSRVAMEIFHNRKEGF